MNTRFSKIADDHLLGLKGQHISAQRQSVAATAAKRRPGYAVKLSVLSVQRGKPAGRPNHTVAQQTLCWGVGLTRVVCSGVIQFCLTGFDDERGSRYDLASGCQDVLYGDEVAGPGLGGDVAEDVASFGTVEFHEGVDGL